MLAVLRWQRQVIVGGTYGGSLRVTMANRKLWINAKISCWTKHRLRPHQSHHQPLLQMLSFITQFASHVVVAVACRCWCRCQVFALDYYLFMFISFKRDFNCMSPVIMMCTHRELPSVDSVDSNAISQLFDGRNGACNMCANWQWCVYACRWY